MIAEIGLAFLILGWIVQLFQSWKGSKEIHKGFLFLYIIGVIMLVIDGYMSNLVSLAVLNLVSFVVALLVLLRMK